MAARLRTRNALLNELPAPTRDRFIEHAELLTLNPGAVLQEPNARPPFAYFPEDGLASVVAVMEDGSMVEAASIGRDGFLGVPLLLNTRSTTRVIWQVPGAALRIPAGAFIELARDPVVTEVLLESIQDMMDQMAQVAGCNRRHSLVRRAARWLLMTHDRVDGDRFVLTQEFLATMLGAGRPKVTVAAQHLQSAGLIAYRRGTVEVRDREGLERAACDCYGILAQIYPGRATERPKLAGVDAAAR